MIANIKLNPFIFILFGGSGDLASRKLIPAIYNLFLDGWLPDQFVIIGSRRKKLNDKVFRAQLLEGINKFSRKRKAKPAKWTAFSESIDEGIKYTPSQGGASGTAISNWIQEKANEFLAKNLSGLKRISFYKALPASMSYRSDYLKSYVNELNTVKDFDSIPNARIRIGFDQIGGGKAHTNIFKDSDESYLRLPFSSHCLRNS